jgi:glycerol-3-phosphate acyltransferase PlsX
VTAGRLPVVLDAMGGDHAPTAPVRGALQARAAGVDVVLVGDRDRLVAEMAAAGDGGLRIVHTPEAVGMDEDPAIALRAKPRASVRVAVAEYAAGRACAVVSAGSTGATLAAALLGLGRLAGVRRPAVGALLPVRGGVVLLDAGASTDVQPEVLRSFAVMGVAYARALGVERPRVGLLNVGSESGKGNALARAAHDLLEGHDGFAGNVEPGAVLAGAVDVVVTDGFTGNVFLKTLEAARQAGDSTAAAVLLGVAGDVLVAHGASDAADLAAALGTARRVADSGLSRSMAVRLERQGPQGGEP